MPSCGSQIILCEVPIRFDNYVGGSHGCKYCFVTRKADISQVKLGESTQALREFIAGKRTTDTQWCDWNIPLHWGGMSDPFQPAELQYRRSLDCLRIFAETQYPLIVSTKGTSVLSRPEYLELLRKCKAVVQVSMVSPRFDVLEPGAPTYHERLASLEKIAAASLRLIVRIQPYVREVKSDLLKYFQQYRNAGVYGVTIEGIKYFHKVRGMVKAGGDYVYPCSGLKEDFCQLRDEAHKNNLKFFCAENRLRKMGDDMCCCGISGLDGFRGNSANVVRFIHDRRNFKYTSHMTTCSSSSSCFKAICQNSVFSGLLPDKSFADIMELFLHDRKTVTAFMEETAAKQKN